MIMGETTSDCVQRPGLELVLWKRLNSQDHTITESQDGGGWKGPLGIIQSNSSAKAGSPRAGCTGLRPGRFLISPEKKNPKPLWAACSSAPSPSK